MEFIPGVQGDFNSEIDQCNSPYDRIKDINHMTYLNKSRKTIQSNLKIINDLENSRVGIDGNLFHVIKGTYKNLQLT